VENFVAIHVSLFVFSSTSTSLSPSFKIPNKTGICPATMFLMRPIHTPLIESNTLTAQKDNNVPAVAGRNIATRAQYSTSVKFECLRASIKTMPPAKQIAGVTVTVSIHNKGVADQSFLNPLVA
jgi:hypothetical protein